MHTIQLAQCLKEQDEVKDFIPQETLPERLVFIVALAACLPQLLDNRNRVDRRLLMHDLHVNRQRVFLEAWEEFIYPILKDANNESWAGRWRGGHITNDR